MKADQPQGENDDRVGWGSDVAAQMLRRLGIRYASLNPGASYRGLHDSLVNHLGNRDPSMLLCLHEDHAVGVAHGYARATGEPMAAILHSNVGLLHGAMSLYNAWCDRVPMLVLGATGPVDAARRRPWIDWIHTSSDQAALIRDFIKWDDQPASPQALIESMARASLITRTAPTAPVYVCLDAGMQEASLDAEPQWPDLARLQPPDPPRAGRDALERVRGLLASAQRPVLLYGRCDRSQASWDARVRLAERLGAVVMTDLKNRAAFPTDHDHHVSAPFDQVGRAPQRVRDMLGAADVIVAFDWIDLNSAVGGKIARAPGQKVISVSLDHTLHNGAHMNYQALAEVDENISAGPDTLVSDLLDLLGQGRKPCWQDKQQRAARLDPARITVDQIAVSLRKAFDDPDNVTLSALCRQWPGDLWPFRSPLAYLGKDGGGGIGGMPSMAVGAALGLHESGRDTVAVFGDGEFIMGATALWTAVRHRIPLLALVNNNRSYFNDELHQETVARRRNRPVENRWIGQRIADPELDLAQLAQAQGATGIGPVKTIADLDEAIRRGVAILKSGGVCLIDVHVDPVDRGAATTGVRAT